MNADRLIQFLHRHEPQLIHLLEDMTPEEAQWKPDEASWSVLEIVTHIADEEAEDFRPRLMSTLEDACKPWPPIDPQGWVAKRNYKGRNLAEEISRFSSERKTSLLWLQSLSNADWSACYAHPELGPLCAGDLLTAWAAHDILHMKQIVQRKFQMIEHAAGKYDTRYAGNWR